MADGSNPKGTVEQTASADPDALLDRFLDSSEEQEDEGQDETNATEASAEDADTDPAAEAEAEADEADDAEDGEGDTPTDAGRFVADTAKVRLPDGSVVSVADLKQGSLRLADYTRKTQELSARRQELEARQAELAQKAGQFDQQLNMAIEIARANLPQQPDPSQLSEDPIGFLQRKNEYETRLGQLQQLMAAKQQHDAAVAGQRDQAFREWANTERQNLIEALPELRDASKLQAFNADLVKGIEKYGFTPNDLGQVYDHRLILLAKDAIAYQKLQAQKPKAIAKTQGKPPLTPGKRQSPQAEQQRAKKADWDKLRASRGKDQAALDRILDDLI